VEKDPQARQTSMWHVMMLQQRYPHLLPTLTIQGYQHSLPNNITLLGRQIWQGLGQLIWSFMDGHAKVFHKQVWAKDILVLSHVYYGN
jgi:hypothetical protein